MLDLAAPRLPFVIFLTETRGLLLTVGHKNKAVNSQTLDQLTIVLDT